MILRGTVKNVALELRPKVKGGEFYCLWSVFVLDTGSLLHPFPDGFMAILRCNEAVNDA